MAESDRHLTGATLDRCFPSTSRARRRPEYFGWRRGGHRRRARVAPRTAGDLPKLHPSLSRLRLDVRVVGHDVGVNYALSGSVRRSGPRLRVSAGLPETTRGTVVWASHFDGVSEDLFALQDQIAARVVTTIAPQVREAELRGALRKRPDSMEAYDLFCGDYRSAIGSASRNSPGARLVRTGDRPRSRLRRAVRPAGGLARHSCRPGMVSGSGGGQCGGDPPGHRRPPAGQLRRDGPALCGHVKSLLLHEFDEAIALFDRAIEASPSSAIAWTRSSPTYSYIGDARQAIRRAEEGLRMSSFHLHVFYPHASLGIGLYVAGEYEEGARWGRKAGRKTRNTRQTCASSPSTWPRPGTCARPGR